ncbi:MAG: choice-of-anchor J domain-containing protein [Cyclobacteriaceae bacterium]
MKFIKNNILIIALIGVMFSCNPLEETYDEIDAMKEEVGQDLGLSVSYSLIEEDYTAIATSLRRNANAEDSAKADFVSEYNAFNANISFGTFLGDLVNEKYPQLNKGAAVKVTYRLLEGESFEDISEEYVNSLEYTLDADDYALVSAQAGSLGFFDSEIDVEEELPGLLASAIQSPNDGDIVTAVYETVDTPYALLPAGQTIFSEDFLTDLGGFESIDISGAQSWRWRSFGEAEESFAEMSGFSGVQVANEDWMVSPEIDLSSATGAITLVLTQQMNFAGASEFGDELRIVYSRNYSGDVTTATWIDITLDQLPAGDNNDPVVGSSSLAEAGGNKIHLGFYYRSTDTYAARWRIVNIDIEEGVAPETQTVNTLYQYDGSEWVNAFDDAYYLTSDDYDAMGEGNNQPGRFDNFSSSTLPNDYLPTFLADLFPFAQEGDEFVVVYKYFSGGVSTRGSGYVFESGMWTPMVNDDQIVNRTDQYVNTGQEFVFNPSVTLTMVSSDFQIITDEVKKTRPELVNSFGTGEDLYGADAFFVNFDTRLSSRLEEDDNGEPLQPEYIGLSAEESAALIAERVTEGIKVMLEVKYADVQPIDGIDIFYTVSYVTFDGTDGTGTEVFLVTGPGTFEAQ